MGEIGFDMMDMVGVGVIVGCGECLDEKGNVGG